MENICQHQQTSFVSHSSLNGAQPMEAAISVQAAHTPVQSGIKLFKPKPFDPERIKKAAIDAHVLKLVNEKIIPRRVADIVKAFYFKADLETGVCDFALCTLEEVAREKYAYDGSRNTFHRHMKKIREALPDFTKMPHPRNMKSRYGGELHYCILDMTGVNAEIDRRRKLYEANQKESQRTFENARTPKMGLPKYNNIYTDQTRAEGAKAPGGVSAAKPPLEQEPPPKPESQKPTSPLEFVLVDGIRHKLVRPEGFKRPITESQAGLWQELRSRGFNVPPANYYPMLKREGIDRIDWAASRVEEEIREGIQIKHKEKVLSLILSGKWDEKGKELQSEYEARRRKKIDSGMSAFNAGRKDDVGPSSCVPGVEDTLAEIARMESRTSERASSDRPLISAHAQRMIDMGMDPEQAKELFPPE